MHIGLQPYDAVELQRQLFERGIEYRFHADIGVRAELIGVRVQCSRNRSTNNSQAFLRPVFEMQRLSLIHI